MIENLRINLKFKWKYIKKSLREKCPNTDQKKLRIWTLFTQWIAPCLYSDLERILYSDAASDM